MAEAMHLAAEVIILCIIKDGFIGMYTYHWHWQHVIYDASKGI